MHDSIKTYESSVSHTTNMTHPYICQSCQSSVRHTIESTHPSICHQQYTSVCHTINTTSPSVCQPHVMSVCHTNITTSPSVSPSKESSDRHTSSRTSPSLCQSRIPSVCHNVIQKSPSVCQSRDLSVCYPTGDARHAVCSSSVTSVLPLANPMVKMPTSYPVRNFPHEQSPGRFPFACTSTESSVHHPDSPSINSSPFAANLSKLTSNYGENSTVNYPHENPVKSPTGSTLYDTSVVAPVRASYVPFVCALYVRPIRTSCVTSDVAPVCASSVQPFHTSCITSDVAPVRTSSVQPVRTSCVTSVIARVRALPIPSVLPYVDERQEFPDGFPGTHYGEKNPSKSMVKIPHDVTLTLQQAKFPVETPDIPRG